MKLCVSGWPLVGWLLLTAVVATVLAYFIAKFIYRPVYKMMREREKKIGKV